jgi:hypothetical protein
MVVAVVASVLIVIALWMLGLLHVGGAVVHSN